MTEGMPGRAVTIHDLDQACIAMGVASRLGVPIILLSAPAAVNAIGPTWFAAIIKAARDEFPEVAMSALLDCHTAGGRAMAALKTGIDGIVFTGSVDVLLKLADIGENEGCTLLDHRPEALDLMDVDDPVAACEAWLGR